MAGDWIKWTVGLAWKPEVLAMAEMLHLHRIHVAGLCMTLWEWADANTRDGCNARGVTGTLPDSLTGVTGFGEALRKVGWIRQTDEGIEFINGDRHNGQTAKDRALTAKRVASHRARSCNDSVTLEPLPEKRREEKIEDKDIQAAAPPVVASEVPPSEPEYPAGMTAVWNAAPAKARTRSSRVQCRNEWKRAKLEPIADKVLAGLELWKRSDKWQKDDGAYVEGLHIWLKYRKWEEPPGRVIGTKPRDAPNALQSLPVERRREIAEEYIRTLPKIHESVRERIMARPEASAELLEWARKQGHI